MVEVPRPRRKSGLGLINRDQGIEITRVHAVLLIGEFAQAFRWTWVPLSFILFSNSPLIGPHVPFNFLRGRSKIHD